MAVWCVWSDCPPLPGVAIRCSGSGLPAEESPEEEPHIFMKWAVEDTQPQWSRRARRYRLTLNNESREDVHHRLPMQGRRGWGGLRGLGVCVGTNAPGCNVHIRTQNSSHSPQLLNLYLSHSSWFIPDFCLLAEAGVRYSAWYYLWSSSNLEKLLHWS